MEDNTDTTLSPPVEVSDKEAMKAELNELDVKLKELSDTILDNDNNIRKYNEVLKKYKELDKNLFTIYSKLKNDQEKKDYESKINKPKDKVANYIIYLIYNIFIGNKYNYIIPKTVKEYSDNIKDNVYIPYNINYELKEEILAKIKEGIKSLSDAANDEIPNNKTFFEKFEKYVNDNKVGISKGFPEIPDTNYRDIFSNIISSTIFNDRMNLYADFVLNNMQIPILNEILKHIIANGKKISQKIKLLNETNEDVYKEKEITRKRMLEISTDIGMDGCIEKKTDFDNPLYNISSELLKKLNVNINNMGNCPVYKVNLEINNVYNKIDNYYSKNYHEIKMKIPKEFSLYDLESFLDNSKSNGLFIEYTGTQIESSTSQFTNVVLKCLYLQFLIKIKFMMHGEITNIDTYFRNADIKTTKKNFIDIYNTNYETDPSLAKQKIKEKIKEKNPRLNYEKFIKYHNIIYSFDRYKFGTVETDEEGVSGGYSLDYKNKYLKYKSKYLKLKKLNL